MLRLIAVTGFVLAVPLAQSAGAQQFLIPGGQNQGFNGPNGPGQQGQGQQGQQGQQGGGANADFDSLIDLIVSTVASESWAENGGGEAEIRPYVGGVYADASGLLRRIKPEAKPSLKTDLQKVHARLSDVRDRVASRAATDHDNPRSPAILRCLSLTRLEREMQRRLESAEPVQPEMLTLAGLRRVQFVVFLNNPSDVILAGPAGDWRVAGDGRVLAEGGGSVVRLDDLLEMLRRSWLGSSGAYGCSINPRAEALSAAQDFLNKSKDKPTPPGKRDAWLEQLGDLVGQQDIEVFGVDPQSRAAGVLVEADHHMKLIGMGLADGVPGVDSYLEGLAGRGARASTGVLRWWFAMNYSAINSTPEGDAWELVGPGAMVMSENEMLNRRGQRVAAGQRDELAEEFASAFTERFPELCRKYPVYSELRNLFDLSLVVELIRTAAEEGAHAWAPSLFVDRRRLPLPGYEPAQTVETVVSHRVVNKRRFVAGVSGGVWGDARAVLTKRRINVDRVGYGPLGEQPISVPKDLGDRRWWWDVER